MFSNFGRKEKYSLSEEEHSYLLKNPITLTYQDNSPELFLLAHSSLPGSKARPPQRQGDWKIMILFKSEPAHGILKKPSQRHKRCHSSLNTTPTHAYSIVFTHPILLVMLLSADTPKPTDSFPPSFLSTAIADCHPLSANSSALVADVCVVDLKVPAQQMTQSFACWGFHFTLNQRKLSTRIVLKVCKGCNIKHSKVGNGYRKVTYAKII